MKPSRVPDSRLPIPYDQPNWPKSYLPRTTAAAVVYGAVPTAGCRLPTADSRLPSSNPHHKLFLSGDPWQSDRERTMVAGNDEGHGMNPRRSAGIVAALALAIFPRLRRKKLERAPPEAAPPAASATGTSSAARGPPPPKPGISRPKPRRPVYTGNRLRIFLPGRVVHNGAGRAVDAPPSRPMTSAGGAGDPTSGLCPSCGARPPPEGGLCDRCTEQARIMETENLLTSLRAKGIDVASAETSVHQARVALALDTFREVEELCERAAAAAKKSDSDHDRARELLSECERSIAGFIESGADTSAAQGSLERATGLFNRGQYAAAIGLASEIIDGTRVPGAGPRHHSPSMIAPNRPPIPESARSAGSLLRPTGTAAPTAAR
jgi:hypothetical protein